MRNIRSGAVRMVMGPQSFLLGVEEILYEKELSATVENLLKLFHFLQYLESLYLSVIIVNRKGGGDGDDDIRKIAYFASYADPALLKGPRDKTRVVKYKIPPGTAVKINDHVLKKSRYIFGPEMAILTPHEEFMIFSLSGFSPKS